MGENTVKIYSRIRNGISLQCSAMDQFNYLKELTEQVTVPTFFKNKTVLLGVDLIQKGFDRCVKNMSLDRADRGFDENKT